MSFKVVALVAVVFAGVVLARPQSQYGQPDKQKGMPYDFSYAVQDEYSGNDYGHSEKSDGKLVSGEYYVLLPDGRLQRVKYTADHDTGYVAQVTYEGEASYPDSAPAPAKGGYQ